jgi:hypothetical protein
VINFAAFEEYLSEGEEVAVIERREAKKQLNHNESCCYLKHKQKGEEGGKKSCKSHWSVLYEY